MFRNNLCVVTQDSRDQVLMLKHHAVEFHKQNIKQLLEKYFQTLHKGHIMKSTLRNSQRTQEQDEFAKCINSPPNLLFKEEVRSQRIFIDEKAELEISKTKGSGEHGELDRKKVMSEPVVDESKDDLTNERVDQDQNAYMKELNVDMLHQIKMEHHIKQNATS